MTNKKTQRLVLICIAVLCVGSAVSIILSIFSESLVFFYSPSDLKEKEINQTQYIRIGGLVKEGSIKEQQDIQSKGGISFVLTDLNSDVDVNYSGLLSPLFREGQGIVAEGYLKNEVFEAKQLLTKHDENYMPPEVS